MYSEASGATTASRQRDRARTGSFVRFNASPTMDRLYGAPRRTSAVLCDAATLRSSSQAGPRASFGASSVASGMVVR
jgi:hypothetical protein